MTPFPKGDTEAQRQKCISRGHGVHRGRARAGTHSSATLGRLGSPSPPSGCFPAMKG